MATDVEALTINYTEDDVLVVKELDKAVLTKGAWATLLFRYQEWDPRKKEYSQDRYTIRRYRKINQEYSQQSKFNISSRDQAEKIINILKGWLGQSNG